MNGFRALTRWHIILTLLIGGLVITSFLPSCDKLVTQVNNNTYVDTTLGKECLACHTDQNDQLIVIPSAQWANSRHSSPDLLETPVHFNGQIATATACGPACHTGNGYVDSIVTGHPTNTTKVSVINCFTCHLPHTIPYSTANLDSLRGANLAVTLANGAKYLWGKSNMCANCHKAVSPPPAGTANIILTREFGPHFSAQADVFNGVAGVRFDDSTFSSSHGVTTFPNGCLHCHFGSGQGYDFGEHTFRLQYHDAVHDTTPYLANCNRSGCHTATTVTDFYQVSDNPAHVARGDSIKHYADTLRKLLAAAEVLDPVDTSGQMFRTGNTVSALLAKITYNYLLYRQDGSRGIHNPHLMFRLLEDAFDRWDSIPPQAAFSVDSVSGCAPLVVNFTNMSKFKVDSVFWSFGDNTVSTTENPAHSYDTGGTYTPKLKVWGPGGVDSVVKSNLILARKQVEAKIGHGKLTGCVSAPIAFYDSSTGGVTSREWTFLDSLKIDSVANPTRTWTVAGTYDVPIRLVVGNSCTPLGATAYDTVTVTVDAPPVALFTLSDTSVTTADSVFVTDLSQNARSWEYTLYLDQGQHPVVTEQNPRFVLPTVGAWLIIQKVTNYCSQSLDTIRVIVGPAPGAPPEPVLRPTTIGQRK
jgi:PKD repeat protein